MFPLSEVPCLYAKALETTLLFLEDVFLTGILASKCEITRNHVELFIPKQIDECTLNDSNFILVHYAPLKEKEVIQEILTFGYSEHC